MYYIKPVRGRLNRYALVKKYAYRFSSYSKYGKRLEYRVDARVLCTGTHASLVSILNGML